uniref:Uncharacterized protein n=1 Tax=Ciona savignyi TaxID=51511 RepID=H2ZKS9_CIOSA
MKPRNNTLCKKFGSGKRRQNETRGGIHYRFLRGKRWLFIFILNLYAIMRTYDITKQSMKHVTGVVVSEESMNSVNEREIVGNSVPEIVIDQPALYRDDDGFLVSVAPYTWDVSQRKVKASNISFGRSVEGLKKYKEKITKIKQNWATIDDYCRHHFLGYPIKSKQIFNEDNGSMRTIYYADENQMEQGSILRLEKNSFPYFMEEGIMHYILWSNDRVPSEVEAKQLIHSSFPSDQTEVILFENPNINKSVQGVMHIHAFIRQNFQS